jgi:hypothetical protein
MSLLKKQRIETDYHDERDGIIQQHGGRSFRQQRILSFGGLNYKQEEIERLEEDEAIAILLQRQENDLYVLQCSIVQHD